MCSICTCITQCRAGRLRSRLIPAAVKIGFWPKGSAAICLFGFDWRGCASRRVVTCAFRCGSMAAPGSRHRGQHRRRLPPVQQVVQLLVFRARSLAHGRDVGSAFSIRDNRSEREHCMHRTLFESLAARAFSRPIVRSLASLVRQKFSMSEFASDEFLNLCQLVDPQ